MARFTSEDPSGFDGGDANLYRYVGNSFPNATDPTGESIKPPTFSLPKFNAAPSFSSPSFSSSLASFNAFDPIGSTRSYSGVSYASPKSSLSSGTLFNTAANVFSNTAPSFVSPLAKSAFGAGVSFASSLPSLLPPSPYVGDDGYVHRVGGETIVPQRLEDLPVRIQQAYTQPGYFVSSHDEIGQMVLDPSGAVHYVGDESVMPLVTRHELARQETRYAAGQDQVLRLSKDALTSIPPISIVRDIHDVWTGQPFLEPRGHYSPQDRAQIAAFSLLGGTSSELRGAEEIEEAVRGGAYVLRDPNTGQVIRSGRTGNLAARRYQHSADPLLESFTFDAVYPTNNYAEQRGLAQTLKETYNPRLIRLTTSAPPIRIGKTIWTRRRNISSGKANHEAPIPRRLCVSCTAEGWRLRPRCRRADA
jgi:hypothetical protein